MSNRQQPPPHPGMPCPQQNSGYSNPEGDFNKAYGFSDDGPSAIGFVASGGYAKSLLSTPGAPLVGSSNDPNMAGGSADYKDPMQDEMKVFDFTEKSIRNGFIRKVYSILMLQLAVTVGMIALVLSLEGAKYYVQTHRYVFVIALVVTFVLVISMACCADVRRKAPMNFIFLFVFTVAQSFLLATAACRYDSTAVLMAAGITAVICLALTIFAFQTKWDFTMCGAGLFVALIVLILCGIILGVVQPGNPTRVIFSCLGALIFSLYLVYDTQLMLGGKHKYAVSPEEYIFAALNLYLDIINIFMYILGAGRK